MIIVSNYDLLLKISCYCNEAIKKYIFYFLSPMFSVSPLLTRYYFPIISLIIILIIKINIKFNDQPITQAIKLRDKVCENVLDKSMKNTTFQQMMYVQMCL